LLICFTAPGRTRLDQYEIGKTVRPRIKCSKLPRVSFECAFVIGAVKQVGLATFGESRELAVG